MYRRDQEVDTFPILKMKEPVGHILCHGSGLIDDNNNLGILMSYRNSLLERNIKRKYRCLGFPIPKGVGVKKKVNTRTKYLNDGKEDQRIFIPFSFTLLTYGGSTIQEMYSKYMKRLH